MTEPQQAVRLVVRLLVASLTASVLFAVLTLVFRHDVLAYQQARDPDADPAALAATLWTRPIPILVVAVLYVWVARGLLAGAARAYRRVRIVSVVGFVAVGWLLLSGAYPGWLRGVQVVQLGLLAALIVAVNRRVVRAAFPVVPDPRPRNRKAAWALILLAPFVAEVSLGNIPLSQAWAVLVFVPIYGGGALLIREVVRRTGGGFVSVVILGVAYGLVEEGLVLQSLTSPHLYGAAEWAPRLFGVNSAYTLLNLVYHPVFSIAIPIVLVEMLFAEHGTKPYLRRGGLITAGVVFALGAVLIRLTVPASEDPGYTMPLAGVVIVALLAVALTVVGVRGRFPLATGDGAVPGVGAVAGLAGLVAFGFLGMLWPLAGAKHSLFLPGGGWPLLAVAGAAALVAAGSYVLRRWTGSAAWTRRHTLAACFGALVGHTLFALAGNADTIPDAVFLVAIAAGTGAVGARALGWSAPCRFRPRRFV
ncbi:hypothetical protein [Cryptosporangium phraense]|uniref:Uncharacterized protein n=1 Tax=Cryptosporangium phraense TaxID=2593070 RepID=A0A545AV78_9ACTN|nr:hypothetical protein [Cryptosporangium phraense]TQS45236.1 hypothetical protein FL583_09025 [Cryptosporangium phraense]